MPRTIVKGGRLSRQLRAVRRAALAALLLTSGVGVCAQTVYRCQDSGGKTIVSDRPCDNSTTPAGTVATQPAAGPRWSGPARPAGAPEHYDYLSGSCKSLHDALRNAGQSRNWQTQRNLQHEWRQRCQDDEADAYRVLWEKKQAERGERVAAKKAEASQQQLARNQKQICDDMAQILAAKRARTDLNEAERAELQRFAEHHRERCR